jgi:tetratricopeptide (TPR) repeat protein
MRQHRDLEGFEHLRRAAALRPDRFMAYGRLGQAYEQLGLVPEAIAAYRQELAVRPAAMEARVRLGGALELEGALSAGWAGPDLWINLGLALDSLGRYWEAIDRFGQALQASPGNAVAMLGLARSHLHLGQKDLARADYETLKKLDPQLAEQLRRELDRS